MLLLKFFTIETQTDIILMIKNSSCHLLAFFLVSAYLFNSISAFARDDSEVTKLTLSSFGDRLSATSEEARKAISKQQFGAVSLNQRALALKVELDQTEDALLKAHMDTFDFYLIPVTVGVIGRGGSSVQGFQVNLSFPERRVKTDDAWLIDVYPRIETVAGRVTGNTEIAVSGAMEIGTAPVPGTKVGAKIDGKATVSYKYNPVFQSFGATFDQANAIWSFDKVAGEVKAGPIDLRLLVAVRKEGRVAADKLVFLTARIKANFSGGVFFGRSAEASGKIKVTL